MGLNDYEKRHNRILRKYGAECTVLLRKDGHFPIERGGTIALYGSGARQTIKGGTGSGEVNSRFYVTIEKGLERAGYQITTKSWLDRYDQIREQAKADFLKKVKQEARARHTLAVLIGMGRTMPEPEYQIPMDGQGDTAIYVLSRVSGEGSDRKAVRGDIKLTKTEIRDIRICNEQYENFMLVLNVGGVVDLSEVTGVKNILLLSQLGVKTGDILADIILGRSNPSGKLSTTWSSWKDYCRIGDFGEKDDTRYREGIYVGYRYFDSVGKTPLYPFGYGLSYTEFTIGSSKVEWNGEQVTVYTEVTNTGGCSGKEVVQVYVSIPEGRLDEPYQVLAGFAKTKELTPGETTEVQVSFFIRELAPYCTDMQAYILETGDYIVRVGNSSRNTVPAGMIRLKEEVVVTRVRSIIPAPDFADWKPDAGERQGLCRDDVSHVPVIELEAGDLETIKIDYETECDSLYHMEQRTGCEQDVYCGIEERIQSMPMDRLMKTSIGAYNEKNVGLLSIIGNAGSSVAGAAGQTYLNGKDYGIPSLVMADGPAGLRLTKHYVEDEKGVHGLGEAAVPESMMEYLPKVARGFMRLGGYRPKKDAVIRHQYATAIPIGTAIAQSFNPSFAELCGNIVGTEMQMFHVHLWLAPALNIHRDIRCGRNFEYYSEDPLISGLMAAAITKGVQQHKGCGTTIKHYAANNQERNRTQNNSMMSERTLREIYLKGFEICVKRSQPKAVMTSYNLLNGTHTSESKGLIRDALRCEFGYRGLVMTDWVIHGYSTEKNCKYPAAHAPNVIMAGGDLFMPGTKSDYEEVRAAYEEGTVTKEQLQINAARIARIAGELIPKA